MNVTTLTPATAPIPLDSQTSDAATGAGEMSFSEVWADKAGPTFLNLLDIINPLQHIPIINTIYRDLTGDEIGFASRLIGAGLLGGPVGFAGAVVSMAAEEAVGEEPVSRVVAALQEFFSPAETAGAAAGPELAVLPGAAGAAKNPQAAATEHNALALPIAAAAAAPASKPISPAPASSVPLPAATGAPGTAIPTAARKAPQQIAALSGQPAESESARISRKILAAQKVQASILLASIGMGPPERAVSLRPDENEKENRESARAVLQHPNTLPAGASPEWIQRAMGRGLDKYQETLRLRGAGVALPLPSR